MKKLWIYLLSFSFSFIALSCTKKNSHQKVEKTSSELQSLFSHPLIVGASVSANHNGVESPGRLLTKKLSGEIDIEEIARDGALGREILVQVQDEKLADRSIVIGVDLFFWDSVQANCDASIEALNDFVGKLADLNLPFIIARVPRLFKTVPVQPCRTEINDAIEDICDVDAQCFTLPLDDIYEKVLSKKGLHFKDKFYSESELIPDGLHLSLIGSEFVAEEIEKLIR